MTKEAIDKMAREFFDSVPNNSRFTDEDTARVSKGDLILALTKFALAIQSQVREEFAQLADGVGTGTFGNRRAAAAIRAAQEEKS